MRLIYQISALVLAATPAMAKDAYFVGPVYSQLVSVLAPSDFTPGFEHEADGFYILELTPAGETVENWTQLITITGSKDAAKWMTPREFLTEVTKGILAECPDTITGGALPPVEISGAASAVGIYLGCGSINGQSEEVMEIAIQGRSDIYTVQWAAHGPATDKLPEPDPAIWTPRFQALAATLICDKVAGEKPPYAPCTQ